LKISQSFSEVKGINYISIPAGYEDLGELNTERTMKNSYLKRWTQRLKWSVKLL
jgi:hypothetical protein